MAFRDTTWKLSEHNFVIFVSYKENVNVASLPGIKE